MDKKDIYEHLAKIYLDASSKKVKKPKRRFAFKIFFSLIGIAIIFIPAIVVSVKLAKQRDKLIRPKSEFALVLEPDIVKINFHFRPAKKEIYSINLNQLDLTKYKRLGFSARKADYQDNLALKIEFTTVFKEKSEVYLTDFPSNKWRDYKIDLADFKNINDWSNILNLSFVVEEWNVRKKKGIIYLDSIRFLH